MGFHHVALATRDLAATHAFYTEAMGFELVKAVVAPTDARRRLGQARLLRHGRRRADRVLGPPRRRASPTSTRPSPTGLGLPTGSTTSPSTPTTSTSSSRARAALARLRPRRAWRSTTASACRSTPSTRTASWSSGAPTPGRLHRGRPRRGARRCSPTRARRSRPPPTPVFHRAGPGRVAAPAELRRAGRGRCLRPTAPVLGYWPDPPTSLDVAVGREPVTLVSPDGAVVRGILWTPPAGTPWRTAVALSHPRGDFSVHYACPLLAAAGYAVLGFATRYVNNDIDCLHENCVTDVQHRGRRAPPARRRGGRAARQQRRRFAHGAQPGAPAAPDGRATARRRVRRAGRPPGRGRVHAAGHRPVGHRRGRSVLGRPVARHVRPRQRLAARGPSRRATTAAGSTGYRGAQRDRVARIDAVARRPRSTTGPRPAPSVDGREPGRGAEPASAAGRSTPATSPIYRTLADPAYLDLSIDPDDRALGTCSPSPTRSTPTTATAGSPAR